MTSPHPSRRMIEHGTMHIHPRSALKFAFFLSVATVMVLCDQALKWSIAQALPVHGRIEITPWFNLVHVLNPGAAFSFLADASGWQRHFLTAAGLSVSGLLLFWLWRGVADRLESAAFVSIVSGALGNVADRIRSGAVVDYLDFHWHGWHWPAFNLADVYVVSGAAMIVLAGLLPRHTFSMRGKGAAHR